MTEINTFSGAVDAVIERSGRIDRQADIIAYLRTTMRETQVLAFFEKDMVEDTLPSVNVTPYIWTYPRTFRQMRAVRYTHLADPQGKLIYPKYIAPGRLQERHDHMYYQSGTSFVFSGHLPDTANSANTVIDVAYYAYFGALQYYATALRPAAFSLETDTWTYLTAVTATEQEVARALVTNWMLESWFDMVQEGALAKLYKTNDDVRSATTYSMYKQLQTSLMQGEARAVMNAAV